MLNGFRRQYLSEIFGGRRPFALHLWHSLAFAAGRYRCYQDVDLQAVEKVIFVCSGNICRSAFAAHLARRLGVPTESAGLNTTTGLSADPQAQRVSASRGIDMSNHRTTSIHDLTLRRTDLVLVMEPGQLQELREKVPGCPAQIGLLGLWSDPPMPYLQDPYGRCDAYFNNCFDRIEVGVKRLSGQLVVNA